MEAMFCELCEYLRKHTMFTRPWFKDYDTGHNVDAENLIRHCDVTSFVINDDRYLEWTGNSTAE